jgi:hypothetical protein
MAIRPEWMSVGKSITRDLFTCDEQNVVHVGPVGWLERSRCWCLA